MPSPLAKKNLKATNLAMKSGVPLTSSPVAVVRRTLAPRLTPAETQPHKLATLLQPRLQNWHQFSHDAVLVWQAGCTHRWDA
jgi:hypothetical protein